MSSTTPTSSNAQPCAGSSAAGQIITLAYEEAEDDEVVDAEQLVFNVSGAASGDLTPVRQIMHGVVDRLDYLHRHKGELLGVPSGFSAAGQIAGRLQKSDLIILAARPEVGKTSLALGCGQRSQTLRPACGLFSLEMSNE